MQGIHTKGMSKEYKKYLHEDFLANEKHYWRMREELLRKYRGQWVAIHKGIVVASSEDVWKITEAVGKLGFVFRQVAGTIRPYSLGDGWMGNLQAVEPDDLVGFHVDDGDLNLAAGKEFGGFEDQSKRPTPIAT